MFRRGFLFALLTTVLTCPVSVGDDKPAPHTGPAPHIGPDPHARRHAQTIEAAQRDAEAITGPPSASLLTRWGDALLRGGQCEKAVEKFEQAIKLDPESEPYLWQHGIALFFVGRYADGAALFEKHRKVNPHDVENAAWHFLCVAKDRGLEEARKLLLPAPGDRRAPMQQILERLPGGDDQAIQASVGKLSDSPQHSSARFYADLYLGLIADAEGDSASAKKWMQQSARTDFTHYMADVARVYATNLHVAQSQK